MLKLIRIAGMIILIAAATAVAAGAQDPALVRDYVIGPGDLLHVSVWKDEALTRLLVVLPDGMVAFPLIGQVKAGGRTVAELSAEIEQKLERFLPDVTLSVVVQQVNSMVVYVIGRVNNPNRFPVTSDVNVLQALSMAGGLNPFAKRGDIKIFREIGGVTKIIGFDYDTVAGGENVQQNIRLQRGDVIVVP